jgi:hypothetical protein
MHLAPANYVPLHVSISEVSSAGRYMTRHTSTASAVEKRARARARVGVGVGGCVGVCVCVGGWGGGCVLFYLLLDLVN